ncbi:cytochrome P450 [Apodospora peruviana]|uniref:Cytochrome P450 n=1 Tax=Apodospora peruviana TaxID=516989 RepID=A0AAE0IJN3_9PEZI|nr:cytochrome P450 [Apodospora peruviana]
MPNNLSIAALWAWATALLVVWYVVTATAAWYRLRHIPGPWLARFSYLWKFYTILSGKTSENFIDLNRYNSGTLVITAPDYLVTSDPNVLRKTMASRSVYTRDGWYLATKFRPDQENMASTLDTAAHDLLKAKTASGYSGREIGSELEAVIDSQILRFVDLIRRKYLSKQDRLNAVDFAPISRYFTMDVITRLLFGEPFGHLDEGMDVVGWIGAMDSMLPVLTVCMEMPLIRGLFFSKFGLGLFGPKPTDNHGLGRVMGVVNELIRQRFESDTKGTTKDMMGGFIRNGMTRHECEGEAMIAIVAGSDTTAGSIRATLLCLMANPRVYARLKREIKQAVEQGVSNPITNDQAAKLPYLQAVIWEGFRFANPISFGHPKVVPPGGDEFNGIFVPAGTRIGHNTLGLTRNEKVFGKDVNIFRPERFLECAEDEKTERMRALDIVFGGGRWTCAGRNVALVELNKIFFELLRAFDFQAVNPYKPVEEFVYVARQHRNMWVRISEADWERV